MRSRLAELSKGMDPETLKEISVFGPAQFTTVEIRNSFCRFTRLVVLLYAPYVARLLTSINMICYNRLKGEITMNIDLPQDLIERVQQHVAILPGANEADVIRKALDSLDWQDGERQAIQEGIVAMKEGRVQDFEQFDREFRQEHGIASDA